MQLTSYDQVREVRLAGAVIRMHATHELWAGAGGPACWGYDQDACNSWVMHCGIMLWVAWLSWLCNWNWHWEVAVVPQAHCQEAEEVCACLDDLLTLKS